MFERVSFLVPVYNNAEMLRSLVTQVTDATRDLAREVEFVFVEDASYDSSREVLREIAGGSIRIIYNSENIGQQASIRKGLAACEGQAVVVMDADLQDPPQAIPALLRALHSGAYDAVFATRVGAYQSGWRMLNSHLFRFVIRRLTNLPRGAGGFVAITGDLAQALSGKTSSRFYLVGMIGCGGYRIGAVPIIRNPRESGKSGYTGAMRLSLGLSNLSVILDERIARGPR